MQGAGLRQPKGWKRSGETFVAMSRAEGILNKMDRALGILSGVCVAVSVVAVVGISALITVHTLDRKYLHWLKWTFVEEWTGYLLVLVVFFALAYTLRTQGHIIVDLAVRLLPKRARDGLEFFTSLLALAVLGFMTERSTGYFLYAWSMKVVSTDPSLTPMWIPYLFVPIGLGVFALAVALHMVRKVVLVVTGR